MAPVLLAAAVPELKKSAPLAPAAPPFVDRIFTSPLEVALPSPLNKLSRPPVATVLRPAMICTSPPTPLVPLPTVKAMDPPVPSVAAPDPSHTAPELPLDADPDEKTSMPLEPASPEFALRITTDPLDDAVPSPLPRLNAPPVAKVLRPDASCMIPPAPLVPLPTVIDTDPPVPAVAVPVESSRAPLLPLVAIPE
jgi:hypothetical protein